MKHHRLLLKISKTNTCGLQTRQSFKRNEPFRKERGINRKSQVWNFRRRKELPQLAMSRVFRDGDFRSGYYRDQTFAMAIHALTPESFFASLYADTDVERDPASAGRQMNGHFATRSLNEDGSWKDLTKIKISVQIFLQQQDKCLVY